MIAKSEQYIREELGGLSQFQTRSYKTTRKTHGIEEAIYPQKSSKCWTTVVNYLISFRECRGRVEGLHDLGWKAYGLVKGRTAKSSYWTRKCRSFSYATKVNSVPVDVQFMTHNMAALAAYSIIYLPRTQVLQSLAQMVSTITNPTIIITFRTWGVLFSQKGAQVSNCTVYIM